ncbi:hypothetical protein [Burkholderia pseudomallei]|uniref:hypothetical protein n=1 Tax=Burkholderia pseudomallei TaxID=28450 RepID=UPI00139247F4|nr:hypothetical protein [Burkholderia pseudomallei]MBF3953459.1 hypothetical protein [Burkholderia pseudomallei]MBF4107758.1 hypothetical protein [Burkholderia pseudomallei]MDV2150838.1 hypothetical protein [Burkholderia pseudomallei]
MFAPSKVDQSSRIEPQIRHTHARLALRLLLLAASYAALPFPPSSRRRGRATAPRRHIRHCNVVALAVSSAVAAALHVPEPRSLRRGSARSASPQQQLARRLRGVRASEPSASPISMPPRVALDDGRGDAPEHASHRIASHRIASKDPTPARQVSPPDTTRRIGHALRVRPVAPAVHQALGACRSGEPHIAMRETVAEIAVEIGFERHVAGRFP